MVRKGLFQILSALRLLRMSGEILSNLIPGLDIVGDAALALDLAQMAKELAIERDYGVAIDFIKYGPYKLEDLRVSDQDESFQSFDGFKKIELEKRLGPAGDGYDYRHVAEKRGSGNFPDGFMHSTRNIIRIPRILHEEISASYARRNDETGKTIRD